MATGQGFGVKCTELLVKYDQERHSWKTHQCLLSEDLQWSSVILPKWGIMQGGVCLEVTPFAGYIIGNGAGYLPTPKAGDYKKVSRNINYFINREKKKYDLAIPLVLLGMSQANNGQFGKFNPETSEEMMGWVITWTELEPLGTDKIREWLNSHGIFLEDK